MAADYWPTPPSAPPSPSGGASGPMFATLARGGGGGYLFFLGWLRLTSVTGGVVDNESVQLSACHPVPCTLYCTGYPDSSSARALHPMHHAMLCHVMSCPVGWPILLCISTLFGLATEKTMELCKTKAKNGFTHLKIGECLASTPSDTLLLALVGWSRWATFLCGQHNIRHRAAPCGCAPSGRWVQGPKG